MAKKTLKIPEGVVPEFSPIRAAVQEIPQGSTSVGHLSSMDFSPNREMRILKGRFVRRISASPFAQTISTAEHAYRLLKDKRIYDWWSLPGFSMWLLDTNEHDDRIDYLFGLSLEAAEEILLNDDPKAQTARVAMVKHISELAGKMPSAGNSGGFLDEAVSKMDKASLVAHLEKGGVTLSLSATSEKPRDVADIRVAEETDNESTT